MKQMLRGFLVSTFWILGGYTHNIYHMANVFFSIYKYFHLLLGKGGESPIAPSALLI